MKKRIASLFLVICMTVSALPAASAAQDRTAYEAANALYTLGLFEGTGQTADGAPVFSLSDLPTRAEAVTMLVRLLGKEEAAQSGAWRTPFTDVPDWAAPYVGYAYENGLARGVADDEFAAAETVSNDEYLTFLLRALGYDDSAGDFALADARSFAAARGLQSTDGGGFTRGDVAQLSCDALGVARKGTDTTLLQALVDEGAVTAAAVQKAGLTEALTSESGTTATTPSGGLTENKDSTALTAEQVYAACSPAVFYIEVYDATKTLLGTGSGFFISADGKAVTNYHVIEDASYATVTLADGQTTYDVAGVYDYDTAQDVALIKVNGKNFPYLTPGDASSIVGGAKVYAIGSPLGLSNTISEGIISNVSRTLDGTNYIQITAAISPGSSGGALLNSAGKVIGITSAGIQNGQSLNFAVPYSDAAKLSASSLKTLSQALAGLNGASAAFYPSSSSVTVKAGESTSVTLTQTFAGASTAGYTLSNRQAARVRWGSWSSDGRTVPLVITGLTAGETDVQLTLYGNNSAVLAQTTIHVTVTR